MGKTYTQVPNESRKELIRLIYEEGYTIAKAAGVTGIYYPTAKAINKVFKKEKRVQKRSFRYRTKKEDLVCGVTRNKIAVERLATQQIDEETRSRITCGIRLLLKNENLNGIKADLSSYANASTASGEASTVGSPLGVHPTDNEKSVPLTFERKSIVKPRVNRPSKIIEPTTALPYNI